MGCAQLRGDGWVRDGSTYILVAGINPRSAPFIAAFEQRLRELGWIEGKNLSVEFAAGETRDQLEKAAARFVENHADAILAAGPELGAQAARHSTQTIPIVIVALNYDPVEKGFARSLARPGHNITGVHFRNPEVGAKQLDLLHAAFPAASRVGLLWTKYSADQIPPVESTSQRLRLQLEKVELRPPYDIAQVFTMLKTRHVEAAVALGDKQTVSESIYPATAGSSARTRTARSREIVGLRLMLTHHRFCQIGVAGDISFTRRSPVGTFDSQSPVLTAEYSIRQQSQYLTRLVRYLHPWG